MTDETVQSNIDTVGLVRQVEQNSPILEPVMYTPLMHQSSDAATPIPHRNSYSSPKVGAAPETQNIEENNGEMCPILRKDLYLVRHVLVQPTDEVSLCFICCLELWYHWYAFVWPVCFVASVR